MYKLYTRCSESVANLAPKTSMLGTLGCHFGDLVVHCGDSGRPLGAGGDVWGSEVVFVSIWGGLQVSVGGHFGFILDIFSDCSVSKWEVGLRTALGMPSGWKKNAWWLDARDHNKY